MTFQTIIFHIKKVNIKIITNQTHGAPAAAGVWGADDMEADIGAELVCGACRIL